MTAHRNRDPNPLRKEDPGVRGAENFDHDTQQSTAQLAEALKRAGHVVVPPDAASARARQELLAALAEHRCLRALPLGLAQRREQRRSGG